MSRYRSKVTTVTFHSITVFGGLTSDSKMRIYKPAMLGFGAVLRLPDDQLILYGLTLRLEKPILSFTVSTKRIGKTLNLLDR
jgi:hypothetical protein